MRYSVLLAAAVLAASPLAHADTLYTNAAQFNTAAATQATVTFGATLPSPGYTNVATYGNPYTVTTSGGPVVFSLQTSSSNLNINSANYYGTAYPDGNYALVFGQTPADILKISIPSATAFSLNLGGLFAAENGVTITLSDGFTTTLNASGSIDPLVPLNFFGFTTSSPITSATLTLPDGSNEYAAFDNVSYGTALTPTVTPEPASVALLGTGILGIAGLLRKRLS